MQFCEFLTRQRRPKVGIALADNIERVLCKVIWQLVIAEISTTAVSDIWRADSRQCNRRRRYWRSDLLRRCVAIKCGQTPVDNVLNDFESVNFIQSENVRCMSRYQNPSMVNLRVTYPGAGLTT